MPTIGTLPTAQTVSDSDEIAIWRNGVTLNATRAQLLGGVQAEICLPPGALAGRASATPGDIEPVVIGANLSLSAGTLSAGSPFNITGLAAGEIPQGHDRLPLLQNGNPVSVDFTTFGAGLSNLSGIDISQFEARPSLGTASRSLAALFNDAISIESFGAAGDGVTDDTAAFQAAALSGAAIRLGSTTYLVNGQVAFTLPTSLIGEGAGSRIVRTAGNYAGAWLSVSAASFAVHGVQFDAGGLSIGDTPALLLGPSCIKVVLADVSFTGARGGTTGYGLQIVSGASAQHIIRGCCFFGNGIHGLAVQGLGSVIVDGCTMQGNQGAGVYIDSGVSFQVKNCTANQNATGISVGSVVAQGVDLGSVVRQVTGNCCSTNSDWGISSLSGGVVLNGNTLVGNGMVANGGGLIVRGTATLIYSNMITKSSLCIDGRGASQLTILGNSISGGTGVLIGGGQSVIIRANSVGPVMSGVRVTAVEPALYSATTGGVEVDGNSITLSSSNGAGVWVADGVIGVCITDNGLFGIGPAVSSQALWLHTDQAYVAGNRWNGSGRPVLQINVNAGTNALIVPDWADSAVITSVCGAADMVLTEHQIDVMGQITFIRVTATGSGYSSATVQISGSGSGAAAEAIVAQGQVLWIIVTNPGSGYGGIGATAQVTISGDGVGAAASAYVGLPVLDGRQVHLVCSTAMSFSVLPDALNIQSWTGAPISTPAFGAIDLEGLFGAWVITGGTSIGYVDPSASGGVTMRSLPGGTFTLQPGGEGILRIADDMNPVGYSVLLGHGAPTGVVAAPPGSDYRNLDGGAGNTMWVKQVGDDTQGWIAVA